MIVTVTMNPAIDKTVELASFVHGGLNRIEGVILDASGKGINVSATIKELGGESVATGFMGGNNGLFIKEALREYGIETDFVEISSDIRVNTKIAEANGTFTELNETGPLIPMEQQTKLWDKLMGYAGEDTWFVLSGSVPPGVSKTIYRDIIEAAHRKGAKVFLDAEGELFSYGIEAKPDVIKPNRVELEKYIGVSEKLSQENLIQIGEEFLKQGVGTVIISLGQDGAVFLTKERKVKCPAVPVVVHSTVGAGDAMVAAFTYGAHQGYSFEECIRLAMATSAAAVGTYGTKPPKRQEVDALIKNVRIIH